MLIRLQNPSPEICLKGIVNEIKDKLVFLPIIKKCADD